METRIERNVRMTHELWPDEADGRERKPLLESSLACHLERERNGVERSVR